jgi:hypothetical protein
MRKPAVEVISASPETYASAVRLPILRQVRCALRKLLNGNAKE